MRIRGCSADEIYDRVAILVPSYVEWGCYNHADHTCGDCGAISTRCINMGNMKILLSVTVIVMLTLSVGVAWADEGTMNDTIEDMGTVNDSIEDMGAVNDTIVDMGTVMTIKDPGWFIFGPGGDSGRIFAEYGPQLAPILKLSDYDDAPRIQFQQEGTGTESNPQYRAWIGMATSKSNNLAIIGNNLGIGTTNPRAKLQIINAPQTANGNTLILGPTNKANLRLGYHNDYSWIQSHGSRPLSINPIGNNVGIGTAAPTHKFHVKTGNAVGLFESTGPQAYLRLSTKEGLNRRVEFTNRPGGRASIWVSEAGDAFNVLRNGKVGIGTKSPGAKLDVAGFTRSLGVSVNNGANTGVGRGLWLWSPSDTNHVIYSANPKGKSPADKTAARGYFDAGHRLRLRTATDQGFLFENNKETALVDIDSDNGRLWTKGSTYSGGTKNFLIDHPLDPEHKELIHATLEGPEAGVFYRGEAQLSGGEATVMLPDYFEALTRKEDRTVLLTPKFEGDEQISMLAASGVTDGKFRVRMIDSTNPSQKFYWEVKAVRADVEILEVERTKTSSQ